jgi:serine phosphatase RsbU (regulator of sigma subunit)/anti-sigma regulatory factor (Ser/Thr protein kinase)
VADEQRAATETVPARPGPDVVPTLPPTLLTVAPDALDLFVRVAHVIHGPATDDEKQTFVLGTALAATGGDEAAFVRLDPETLDVVAVAGDVALDALGEPVRVEVVRRALRAGAVLDVAPTHPGAPRVLAVPVPRHDQRPHGAIVVLSRRDGAWTDGAVAATQALAAHLGVALDNSGQLQELRELRSLQRDAVRQLQEAVRAPMPTDVPETELGVFYLQADPYAQTGGDLYDWQLLPDGDLLLVVVDVMGKGVAATKDAVNVVHAVRLLVLEDAPLERVIARADEILARQYPELVATLLLGRYTPSTGVLRLVGGGHPPPLVMTRDGETREVQVPGIPIGWPGAGSTEVVTVTLGRSDTAVFYTDGLVEATKDIEDGLARLEVAARETARYPAPSMARALVERALEGHTRRDDSLALVLRRRTPPDTPPVVTMRPFEYRFSPMPANVSLVRHTLGDWLGLQDVTGTDRDDLLLISSELCTNAVRAGSGAPASLALRARADGDAVVLEMEDDGEGFELPPVWADEDGLPDVASERGRGLFLVRALADELTVAKVGGRTVVRAVKRAVLPTPRLDD